MVLWRFSQKAAQHQLLSDSSHTRDRTVSTTHTSNMPRLCSSPLSVATISHSP